MSNTIIYVFAVIAVILVVGFMYYFNSGPVNSTQTVSVDNYMKAVYGKTGGKRKRNKPRKRR